MMNFGFFHQRGKSRYFSMANRSFMIQWGLLFIWRIGTMGYVCRRQNVLRCLASLEQVLRRHGFAASAGAGVDAAAKVYDAAA